MLEFLILGALILPQLLYWIGKCLVLDIYVMYQEIKALRQKGNI